MGFRLVLVLAMDTQEHCFEGIHIGERLPRQGGELPVGIVEEPEYLGD